MRAPTVAPWDHRYRFAAWMNAVLTAWAVRRKLRGSADAVVLWFYDPCFAACIGRAGEQFAVYDCVDDDAEQAGEDRRKQALLSDYDARVASRSRLIFATAAGLTDRHRKSNGKTYHVPNVGDFAHFSQPVNGSLAPSISALAGPVIGSACNFLASKVDFALLEEVATRRPEWTVFLIGPARHDTASALQRLVAHENVRWLGQIPYERLPHHVARFDVATIPYLRNAYTRSCFPLKTFEYLAAGKPVVASGLPDLEGMAPHVVVAEGAEEFVAAIENALASRAEPDVEARRRLASANTWETRTRCLLELVGAEVE